MRGLLSNSDGRVGDTRDGEAIVYPLQAPHLLAWAGLVFPGDLMKALAGCIRHRCGQYSCIFYMQKVLRHI